METYVSKARNFWDAINDSTEWKEMVKKLIPVLNEMIKIDVGGNSYEIFEQDITITSDPNDPWVGLICVHVNQIHDIFTLPGIFVVEIPIIEKGSPDEIADRAWQNIINMVTIRKAWAETFINKLRTHPVELLTLFGKFRKVIDCWLITHAISDPIDFVIVDPRFFVASDPTMRWPTVMGFGFQKMVLFLPGLWASWLYENRPKHDSITRYRNHGRNMVLLDVSYARTDPNFLADMLVKIALGESAECL